MSNADMQTLLVTLVAIGGRYPLKFELKCDGTTQLVKGRPFQITAPDCRTVYTTVDKIEVRGGRTEVKLHAQFHLNDYNEVLPRLQKMAATVSNVQNLCVDAR